MIRQLAVGGKRKERDSEDCTVSQEDTPKKKGQKVLKTFLVDVSGVVVQFLAI